MHIDFSRLKWGSSELPTTKKKKKKKRKSTTKKSLFVRVYRR